MVEIRWMSWPLLLALCWCMSCEQEQTEVLPAFYHWQTRLDIDETEKDYLKGIEARRLYVKFFDVDWDAASAQAIPKASLDYAKAEEQTQFFEQAQIALVPTIFITNRTFKNIAASAVPQLATQVVTKVKDLMPNLPFTELQIDCDWSTTTRTAFFEFLKCIKKELAETTQLSATIRLHQLRYPQQTGVPPVDRGMLMLYNMGDVQDWEEPNSILNLEKTKPYLTVENYALPLDIALPLFQWGVLFREGKMIKLINGLDVTRLKDSTAFKQLSSDTKDMGTSTYQLQKSMYLDGYYLYEGDLLRLEKVTVSNLKKAAKLVRPLVQNGPCYLSFYHLDTAVIEAYDKDVLEDCVRLLSPSLD